MISLNQLKPGETAKISKIIGNSPLKRRIMEMGVTKGTEVFIRKIAPLGDPIEIKIRGYELSLRKEDADIIKVEF